ncbi:MAG: transglutaminase domain-containing protein [Candidatus Paceibacterota bacterium]
MKYEYKKFNIRYTASFTSKYKNNDIKVWFARPTDSECQKIEKIKISPKPHSDYNDKQGNKILYFNFENQKSIKVQMDIKVILWKNKINLLKEKISLPSFSSKIFQKYTKNEKFLEQTLTIKNLTNQITRNDQFILDKIFSITKFLEKNFKYTYPIKNRGVKNLDINNLKGDCGEVGALFVTMCRILGIPARNNTGFVIYRDELNNIYEHGWGSIYLKPYGWIDIDPLANNISEKINKEYLYHQKNYFLSFTKGFNIKINPKIPNKFKIDYWNNLGLPLTNASVQVLQPLVFASKEKVVFLDSIKLLPNIKSPN